MSLSPASRAVILFTTLPRVPLAKPRFTLGYMLAPAFAGWLNLSNKQSKLFCKDNKKWLTCYLEWTKRSAASHSK